MMRFNIVTGTAVIPLLARFVLCAAFFTAGWNKLMYLQEFHGEDAQALIERGVADKTLLHHRMTRAAIVVGPTATPPHDEPAEEEQPPAEQQEDRPLEDVLPSPPTDVIIEDSTTAEPILFAKRMHAVTLMLIKHGWDGRWPVWMARVLTFTELVGGALLLVGLFSRIWALGLSITMVVAFSMTTLPAMIDLGGPFGVASDMTGDYAVFHAMYAQIGLLTLAIVVLLVGPGPVSLDRLLFWPREDELPDEFA